MGEFVVSSIKLRLSFLAWMSILSLSAEVFAQKTVSPQLSEDASQLVRAVIDKELSVGRLYHTHWKYQIQSREGDKETVKEIVETKDCDIEKTVSVNGKRLSPAERQTEDARLKRLASDPDEQKKKNKVAGQDADKALGMFKMLPDAFLYRYSGTIGPWLKLSFKPNPNFHSPAKEAQVFHAMEGTMWITKDNRLVQLEGHLTDEVKFLGGLIGHLDKGGTFRVKRSELSPGNWQTTLLNVQMNGKVAIFKTIHLQKTDSMSNFQRVPGDLTPLQAAEMLKDKGPAADNEQLAAGNSSNQRPARQ